MSVNLLKYQKEKFCKVEIETIVEKKLFKSCAPSPYTKTHFWVMLRSLIMNELNLKKVQTFLIALKV